MRLGPSPWPLVFLVGAGCQVLPAQTIDCASSGRCAPVSFVLGQPDPSSNQNLQQGLAQPVDALVVGTSLFVAECLNNRILGWRTFPTSNQTPPDFVLGQADFNTNFANYGGVSARSLSCPQSLAYGVDKLKKPHLIVGDRNNDRILIWNSLPSSTYQPADVVVGQSEVTAIANANRGPADSLTTASVTTTNDGKLIAADPGNNRVLIWNDIPQQDGKLPDQVLGQPDMSSNTLNNPLNPAGPASWLSQPSGNPSADSGSIWVADTNNHRVLVWNLFPSMDGQAANLVLGQPDFSKTAKLPLSAKSLYQPAGVNRNKNQLFVADQGNNRVLLWNLPLPSTTMPPNAADLVLGQPDMVSNKDYKSVVSASSLSGAGNVYSDGVHLVVPDSDNHRVMIWNLAGIKSGQDASLVLGQPSFTTNIQNNVAQLSEKSLNLPVGITGTDSQLMVSDKANARLLFWRQLPQSGQDIPTGVWGQPDFAHAQRNLGGVSATSACMPAGIATDGTRLFMADPCNNRVLIWNQLPASPGQKADVVLGQPDMTTNTANNGTATSPPSAHSLSGPQSVSSDGQRLLVADTLNNRVLIWNQLPNKSGQDADVVLGQPGMTSLAVQTLDKNSMNKPAGVLFDGTHVIVADTRSDRVLIWNTLPTQNQAPADLVLGQTAFVNDQRLRPPDKWSLYQPAAVHRYQSRLYVADTLNHRILYWNTLPTKNGQNADGVIGQPTFADYTPNNTGDAARPHPTAKTLSSPNGLFATHDMLFIADQGNNRILVLPNPPLL